MEKVPQYVILRVNERDQTNDWGEDYPHIEHEATVEVLDAVGNRRANRLNYTLLIKDALNLTHPIAIELYLEADGSVSCEPLHLMDAEIAYGIKLEE